MCVFIYLFCCCFFYIHINVNVVVMILYNVHGMIFIFFFQTFYIFALVFVGFSVFAVEHFILQFIGNRLNFVVELHSIADKPELVSIYVNVIFPIQSGYTCYNRQVHSYDSDVFVHKARICRLKEMK